MLIFRDPHDSATWIIQALEHDIAAFGNDVEQAKIAFERTVSAYLTRGTSLASIRPAPNVFWEVWEHVASLTPAVERMPSIPAFMMPVVTYDPLPA
ncbi:MAG: hypothetical protein ABIW19_10960 [Vicinamibacterales bacterium]